jgi:hypothetical protein
LYADTLQLVTTGIGNLVDPLPLALRVPWKHPDGTLASADEVAAEWQAVKNNTALAQQGARAAERVTTLRITDADIDALCAQQLAANASTMKLHGAFAGFDLWPADAQMGGSSMAWAMGPGFGASWPHFSAAVAAGDWAGAAINCWMADRGGDLTNRNDATANCFLVADYVVRYGLDPTVLHGPVPWQALPNWDGEMVLAASA